MLHTRICDLLGIELPISNAGMGGVALAPLAAAVSEAGAIGTVALAGFSPEAMLAEISAARALTKKPLGVNLLVAFLRDGTFELLANEPIDAVTLFWGDPSEIIPRAKAAGLRRVVWQCGSAAEAEAAKRAGPAPTRSSRRVSRRVAMCAGPSPRSHWFPRFAMRSATCQCSRPAALRTGAALRRSLRSARTGLCSGPGFLPDTRLPRIRFLNGACLPHMRPRPFIPPCSMSDGPGHPIE